MYEDLIRQAFKEDIGDGDHSSLACVPENAQGKAKLIVKDNGIIAGIELAEQIFAHYDKNLKMNIFIKDGTQVKVGDIAFEISGSSRSILATERLVLNFMQRMSGIATQTNKIVSLVSKYPTKILDTRKTTPGLRLIEKWAVRIGGGHNHRIGLYDMIMLKDNHIDAAGGINEALLRTKAYLKEQQLDLKVEVETRNLDEVKQALVHNVDRIMFDNFSPDLCREGVQLVNGRAETEASGGISLDNIYEYAQTGVMYISVGALTHSVKALDISFKTTLLV